MIVLFNFLHYFCKFIAWAFRLQKQICVFLIICFQGKAIHYVAFTMLTKEHRSAVYHAGNWSCTTNSCMSSLLHLLCSFCLHSLCLKNGFTIFLLFDGHLWTARVQTRNAWAHSYSFHSQWIFLIFAQNPCFGRVQSPNLNSIARTWSILCNGIISQLQQSCEFCNSAIWCHS